MLLLNGVTTTAPVVGAIVLVGWMRQVFRNLRQRKQVTLPDLDFSSQLNDGWPPAVALLLQYSVIPGVLYIGILIVAGVASAISEALGTLIAIAGLCGFALILLANYVMFPEVLRRSFADGDFFPLLKLDSCLSSIRKAGGAYGFAVLGLFIASWIASMGVLLCVVGMLLTYPFGMACFANYLAQYDELIE